MRRLLLLCLLMACAKPPEGPTLGDRPLRIPAAIPAGAIAVSVIDLPAGWTRTVLGFFAMNEQEVSDMEGDVLLYVKSTTGLDVAETRRLAIVVMPGPEVAMVLEGVAGTPNRELQESLSAVLHEHTLIAGTPPAVKACEEALTGKAERLVDGKGPLAPLVLAHVAGSVAVFAAEPAAIDDDELKQKVATYGVQHVVGAVDGRGIHVWVHGDDAKLTSLAGVLEEQAHKAVDDLDNERRQILGEASERGLDAGDLAMVVWAHLARHFVKMSEPEVDHGVLSTHVLLGTGTVTSAVVMVGLGSLAFATAVPSAMKYGKRAKIAEAKQNVKTISDGARSYFVEDRVQPGTGTPLPQQFPQSVGPTPPLGSCCKYPDHKCPPDASLWTGPWADLKFGISDPSYYSYQFSSNGSGPTSSFTVSAFGDLDCDGVYSTFEMYGQILDGEPTTAGGMFMNDELE